MIQRLDSDPSSYLTDEEYDELRRSHADRNMKKWVESYAEQLVLLRDAVKRGRKYHGEVEENLERWQSKSLSSVDQPSTRIIAVPLKTRRVFLTGYSMRWVTFIQIGP